MMMVIMTGCCYFHEEVPSKQDTGGTGASWHVCLPSRLSCFMAELGSSLDFGPSSVLSPWND